MSNLRLPRGGRLSSPPVSQCLGHLSCCLWQVVQRCDMLPLAGLIGLHMLLSGQVKLHQGIAYGLVAGAGSLLLTVACDSWLWQRWLWPEGEVLWFNTVLNRCAPTGPPALKAVHGAHAVDAPCAVLQPACTAPCRSSEWGVSVWHWYWTSALPRALAPALPLAGVGALLDRRAAQLVGVAAAYVALYSYLPHKEVRSLAHGRGGGRAA